MKKTLVLILAAALFCTRLFASDDSFFTPEVSLGTGISIYSESADSLRKQILSADDYKRIVAGLTLDTNINLTEMIKVLVGAEAFSDFLWKKNEYYHSIDYAFFTGIKVFPNVRGLNFSIAYTLGNRSDFFNKKNATKSWGNGFRFSIQYDFMQDRNYKARPFVGTYYRCVPRGNYNTDHILCLYGGVRF